MVGGKGMSDVNSLLEKAVKETKNVFSGEKFLVKDLFKGYEWNRISRSERLLLGTLFLNYINTTKGNRENVFRTTAISKSVRD